MEKLLLLKNANPCKVCGAEPEQFAGPFYIPTKDDWNPFRHRHIPVRIDAGRADRLQFPTADIPAGMRTVPLDYQGRHGGLMGFRYWLRKRKRKRLRRLRAELAI